MIIHHVGILVSRIAYFSTSEFLRTIGYSHAETMHVAKFNCECSLYVFGSSRIELVFPHGGALLNRLTLVGSGTHHIAFQVIDVRIAARNMERQGYRMLLPEPVNGIDNTLVNFVLPNTIGALFEIVQKKG